MIFSGAEDAEFRRLALDVFNANFQELPENLKTILEDAKFVNNFKGEIARVFCITAAGAEGISLKCVRAVHIMEPYWNDVRLKQVKGRAIRIGSHLDLPAKDRNVSIYTYLSVFSPGAQTLKAGEDRIDETIRNADSLDRKAATTLGLPIPEGATQYVLTTDERLHIIAERKKAITNGLESIMKAAAVDCELNIQENKDDSFKCMPLEGSVGDFLYHPDLLTDIRESASKYKETAAAPAPAVAKPAILPSQAPGILRKKLKDSIYRLKPVDDGFEIYADNDDNLSRLLGTAGSKDGKPGPPIKWI